MPGLEVSSTSLGVIFTSEDALGMVRGGMPGVDSSLSVWFIINIGILSSPFRPNMKYEDYLHMQVGTDVCC